MCNDVLTDVEAARSGIDTGKTKLSESLMPHLSVYPSKRPYGSVFRSPISGIRPQKYDIPTLLAIGRRLETANDYSALCFETAETNSMPTFLHTHILSDSLF